MTTVINLFAGPGAGKSTTAAQLFVDMKNLGMKVELVQEYVKQWAWEGRPVTPVDSFYITCKQLANEARLYGHVDFIITDSPIILGFYYDQKYNNSDILLEMVTEFERRTSHIKRINVWVDRDKPYRAHGRYQNEQEAKEIDQDLKMLMELTRWSSFFDLKIKTLQTDKILELLMEGESK